MPKKTGEFQSTAERLKGNAMVGKKATLRQYENVTVSLMQEFYADESNPLEESKKLMDAIDSIIQMARKRWSQ